MTRVESVDLHLALYLHDKTISAFGGAYGLNDQGLLESAMVRAPNKLAYIGLEHLDLFDLAASYALGLVKNHAFHDGNKRTGWAVAILFLNLNGIVVEASTSDAIIAVVRLATGALSEDQFAGWLRSLPQSPRADADL